MRTVHTTRSAFMLNNVWRSILRPICALAIVSCLSNAIFAKDQPNSIRNFDFQSYLIKRNGLTNEGCGSEELPIKNIQTAYADLMGDGNEEAVVEATTCAMGNGGADIVEVFKLDSKGNPASLKIDDSKLSTQDLYKGQFRTPRLEPSNGKLTRWFIQRPESFHSKKRKES